MSWRFSGSELARLESFLRAGGICAGPLTVKPVGDGHSNLTFLAGDGDRHVIVRRPPPPPLPPGAHDVLREATFISALARTAVPVPEVLAVAAAGEVLEFPFFVMSYVPGPIATEATPEALSSPTDRRRMGRLIAEPAGDPPPEFAGIGTWLAAHVPPESGASIVHNDYRIGNVILGPAPPARIAAVLDWELAAIGDPLFDLGYFLAGYPVAGQPLTPTGAMGTAVLEPGYPSRDELAERYAAATGRGLAGLDWYIALAQWKLAVLYEYSRRRAAADHGDPYYDDPAQVRSFLDAAHRTAGLDPVRVDAGGDGRVQR
jgi:aminoglycoside phosphotransferase (APT) family kinase protein